MEGDGGIRWTALLGAVARDVRNDKVGLQAAREQYGVVIDEETMEVDQEATAALRRRLRMQGDG